MQRTFPFLLALTLTIDALAAEPVAQSPAGSFMPRIEDYAVVGWADGFPAHTPGTAWRRVIQTGSYALALDTETLRLPHFGPMTNGVPYADAARDARRAWQALPAAELALTLTVNGKPYRATAGGKWTPFTGPRLIESGRFVQRADVTDLVFTAADGTVLNVESRLETVAWPQRLALILAARPGLLPIAAGEASFGRIGGGFGLTGTNHFEVPHSPELDPEQFTLELWAFVPADCEKATRAFPWLVCKNSHEEADGNFGIAILDGKPQARMNIGGGRDHRFNADARSRLNTEAWNHLAISYDGEVLRLYVNGELAGERRIGRKRTPGAQGLAIGRRQDNDGDGYHFRGVVDELRLYARALAPAEIRERFQKPETAPSPTKFIREWNFRSNGTSAMARPGERWNEVAAELTLTTPRGVLRERWALPPAQTWTAPDWREVSLALDPVSFQLEASASPVVVRAAELDGRARPVDYDPARGWHRIQLDGIEPAVVGERRAAANPINQPPAAEKGSGSSIRSSRRSPSANDAMERVKLELSNPTDCEQTARLLLEKTGNGFRQRIGSPITGMSAVLRYPDGQPTGLPVQLSKNWHGRPAGGVYAGTWFHGFSQVRLPPKSKVELELAIVYGHWGGIAAASHAQLCLIGWGSNQLWDQSALGAWGESICYEPDQVQAECSILDVRPLMVRSMAGDQPWQWTHNVGGGDFVRLFDREGRHVPPARMRAAYHRYGPCLTEVTYAGRVGEGMEQAVTVSLARTDDLVRGTYRVRLDVKQATEFSRFVLFQIGADTYGYTGERAMAVGHEAGLVRAWATQWGGNTNRTPPIECAGRVPWISLHEAVSRAEQEARAQGQPGAPGAWANRGIVIRSWAARLGGQPARPWVRERGVHARGADTSTLDLVPPPGVSRLVPGDFVEATLEHLVVPQFAADYYGPNERLRAALQQNGNTWRMVHREAVGNDRRIELGTGSLLRVYPAVTVRTAHDAAAFVLTGGLGYVPITFTGLSSPRDFVLRVDGQPLDQNVHGADFWQTDYEPESRTWSQTYNVPIEDDRPHRIAFSKQSPIEASSAVAADDERSTQYILVNRAPGQGMNQLVPESLGRNQFEEVLARLPNQPAGSRVQTGISYIFSCFRTPPATTRKALETFLGAAEETGTPVLVQIDTEHWWEARPDLWNWWDPARPGYDPANRANVEWTDWSPDSALRIAWRNWGRQIRVLPPPNLASPQYLAACRDEIRQLVPVVLAWHAHLPAEKKRLLVGIKLGHETSIGVNAYHYPSGNERLGRPAAEDPVRPLDTGDVLARGMAQIGFAALKSSGIRTNGTPAEAELRDVARRYLEMLCREAAQAGVPRERLFAHGAGWKEGELVYDVPVNSYACPGWSFYAHAADPRRDAGVQRNLARSDAPYWAATEWLLQGTRDTAAWRSALSHTLADARCRYVCIFNWESIRTSDSVLRGIRDLVESR